MGRKDSTSSGKSRRRATDVFGRFGTLSNEPNHRVGSARNGSNRIQDQIRVKLRLTSSGLPVVAVVVLENIVDNAQCAGNKPYASGKEHDLRSGCCQGNYTRRDTNAFEYIGDSGLDGMTCRTCGH